MTSLEVPSYPLQEASARTQFRSRMLKWFAAHARELPWRENRDPYRVWISEIMLQQTQVATVVSYFQRFMAAFPNVAALAAADEQSVLQLWEGLGYYRRARQMHAAAKQIVEQHGGEFPRDFAGVIALPGVGRYTAGAIVSIAYDIRAPILEANTIRVLSRLAGYRDDPTKSAGQKLLWQLAEELLPKRDVGQFNQALMELGSLVCAPKNPRCLLCPVSSFCAAFQQGLQGEITGAKKKMQYEEVREAAIVVRCGEKILVRLCGAKERWAGLWDFPRFGISETSPVKQARELREKTFALTGISVTLGDELTTLKHGVTRYRITLSCITATCESAKLPAKREDLRWVAVADLADLPMSTTGRKIAKLLQ